MRCIRQYIEYPSKTTIIKIKPFFDVHWGNRYCDERAFKAYLKDRDEYTYFIGGGDLLDLILVKDAKRYRKSIDKYATRDDLIDAAIDEMVEILEPIKDRLIGLGQGNHEDAIVRWAGVDPTRRLCQRLSTSTHTVEPLGYSWLVALVLKRRSGKSGSGTGVNLIIRGHHGWGGGSRTPGADLTKYSRDMAHWIADIFLYGHVHRKQHDEIPRMGMSGTKLIKKPRLMCICGTFLKTYSDDDHPTYSEASGYPPTEIGGLSIHIKESQEYHKYWVN